MQTLSHRSVSKSTTAKAGQICFTEPTWLALCAYRGDTGRIRVYVMDSAGTPIDVSTATWDADVRVDETAELLFSMEVVPVEGYPDQVEVLLTSEQSALLPDEAVWDLEMTWGGSVTTLFYGPFTALGDVSRPT